jgi:hypothetical protein
MVFQKINKLIYNISSATNKGELFLIDKKGNYILIKTIFKGQSIEDLYRQYCELGQDYKFWEQLQEIYDQSNLVDKMNIYHIYNKLK